MKIVKLKEVEYNKFIEFNKKAYPSRVDNQKRFEFQILQNPLLKDKSDPNVLVVIDEQNDVLGQYMGDIEEYCYKGQVKKCYFGCDYIIDQKCRGKGTGKELAFKTYSTFVPYYAIDPPTVSMHIHTAGGNRKIGDFIKFLWFRNPIKAFTSKFGLIKDSPDNSLISEKKFPDKLDISGYGFKLVKQFDAYTYKPWNPDVLEIARSKDYLNWRFCNEKYMVYSTDMDKENIYFVIRNTSLKGLKLLLLVDFRIPTGEEEKFKLILKAVKKLAGKYGYDGILTMSSHNVFDKMLKNSLFIKVGKPVVILTNDEMQFPEEKITNREFIFSTIADSDTDYNI
jgi:hypothetical protein